MKGTDNEGIERFLDEMKEDIEKKDIEKASDRRTWLLSAAVVTDDKDLFVIEGILGTSISRFGLLEGFLESVKKKGIMEEKAAEDLLGRARDTLTEMIILSKDYLRHRDKTKFFNSIAQEYYTLQEIKEILRLEVKG